MIKHLLSTALIALLCISVTYGQSSYVPTYVPGNLIVQILPNGSLDKIISDNSELDGEPTLLRVNRLLSGPMYAYLLTFDPTLDHAEMRRLINGHDDVSLVQLNHYVQERVLPDDPDLSEQWWHTNIDSDEAWDITTGGLTATGDTIVVCVVDNGGDLDHPTAQNSGRAQRIVKCTPERGIVGVASVYSPR